MFRELSERVNFFLVALIVCKYFRVIKTKPTSHYSTIKNLMECSTSSNRLPTRKIRKYQKIMHFFVVNLSASIFDGFSISLKMIMLHSYS